MDSVVFGPAGLGPHDDDAFRALPYAFMNVACAAVRFRRRAGWIGLAATPSDPRAWTCRIAARPGVYGILPGAVETVDDVTVVAFRLFYFPLDDEATLDRLSLAAALALAQGDAADAVRNFSAHPEFAALFAIATLRLLIGPAHRDVALSLDAEERRRTVLVDGLSTPDGAAWLTPPGGLDEDLPAYAVARDLFAVLAAGIETAAAETPTRRLGFAGPGRVLRRFADGRSEVEDDAEARRLVDVVVWGRVEALPLPDLPRRSDADVGVAAGVGEAAAAERPRLMLLTGFLGSGKTSFLNQFIEYHAGRNELVTVIQNELGERGVDQLLLEGDESVMEVEAGCVCCTLAGVLAPAIRRLVERFGPDVVVLETTGVANPLNMADELAELDDLVDLDGVVTVVDAARFLDTLAASDVARDQIAAADTVVVNKCDLVDEATRARVEAAIVAINPQARLLPAERGRVNPNLLARGAEKVKAAADPHARHAAPGALRPRHRPAGRFHADHGGDRFSVRRIDIPDRIDRGALTALLSTAPTSIHRIKGIVRSIDDDTPAILQYVPGQIDFARPEKPATGTSFLVAIGRDLADPGLDAFWAALAKGGVPCG
ncbi:MAG: GTP-binding protein [Hyphomicrobiales bacterium]|nr:GTP-binding protein [Hyphomicrobiales bacterium]